MEGHNDMIGSDVGSIKSEENQNEIIGVINRLKHLPRQKLPLNMKRKIKANLTMSTGNILKGSCRLTTMKYTKSVSVWRRS